MTRRPNEDDIRRIYRDTIDDLYGLVSRRCGGDRLLAEDVIQETWLRAVRAWSADGVPDVPIAWLSTVASRLIATHFRRRDVATLDDASVDRLPAPDAQAHTDAAEQRSLVERALARLPAMQARLLEAFHFDKRPVAEIAGSMGISERGVEGRLRRARQKLRAEIEKDRGSDSGGPLT